MSRALFGVLIAAAVLACGGATSTRATTARRSQGAGAEISIEPVRAPAPIVSSAPTRESELPAQPTDGGFELESQPEGGVGPLCRGPWRGISENDPFRGVSPDDNGGGDCCPLEGRAFLCVVTPGHQHGPIVDAFVRFFDGQDPAPRLSVHVSAWTNPGMNPTVESASAPPLATLEAVVTGNGFVLRPSEPKACLRPTATTADVCRGVGRYTWQGGLPVRSP